MPSAKLLMVSTTLISTLVSFGGGLIMYLEGLAVVEQTVKEVSEAEIGATARKLNRTFHAAYETSLEYAGLLERWNEWDSPQTLEGLQRFLEVDQFHRTKPHGDQMEGIGITITPLTDTLRNRSAFYQAVWWDPLTVGVPKGTLDYVSGTHLPAYYGHEECVPNPNRTHPDYSQYRCNIVHGLDPANGSRRGFAYAYSDNVVNNFRPGGRWESQQVGWELNGASWWRAADVWVSVDQTPYIYAGWMRVLKQQAAAHPLWGAGYKVAIAAFAVFTSWEPTLNDQDVVDATLVATFLNDGLESQALATNTGALMTHDCARGAIAIGRHPCLVTIGDLSPNIQEACVKANRTAAGRFFRSSIAGSDYWIRRLVIHQMRGGHDELHTPHLVWFRPVSSVEDKLNRSLFLFIGFVAAVFAFDVIILAIEIRKIARPLEQLEWAMDPVVTMDLAESEKRLCGGSDQGCFRVREVDRLYVRFKSTLERLGEYRRFLPEGVLVGEEEAHSTTVSGNLNSLGTPAPSSAGGLDVWAHPANLVEVEKSGNNNPLARISRKSSSGTSLTSSSSEASARGRTTALLGLGDFRNKRASLLMTSMYLGTRAQDNTVSGLRHVEDFVAAVLDICQEMGGINVSAGMWDDAMNVTFTWNALRPYPAHAGRACEAALGIMGRCEDDAALSAVRPLLRVGVASGPVAVGNVGNKRMRAQVAIGKPVEHATLLTALTDPTEAGALCTHTVYEQVRSQVAARAIDAILTRAGEEVLVYELVGTSLLQLDLQTSFVRGMAHLRSGDCEEALAEFRQHLSEHGYDRQAVRLYRIALALKPLQGEARALLRRQQPRFVHLEGAAQEAPLPADIVALCGEKDTTPGVSPRTAFAKSPRVFGVRSPKRPPMMTDAEMLREQIREAYQSASSGVQSSAGEVLPTVFKDAHGRQYNRSDKCLGQGAFGQVWLGMAPDGSMVAVKTIRLRSAAVTGSLHASDGAKEACFLGGGGETAPGEGAWTLSPQHGIHPLSALSAPEQKFPSTNDAARDAINTPLAPGDRSAPDPGSFGSLSDVSNIVPLSAPGQTVARRQVTELIQEVSLMIALRHENVVQFFGCAVEHGHVLIVMEYLPGGSLQGVLTQFGGKLPLSCIRRFTRDMVAGLDFIHHTKPPIVHRDLKPANVLLTIDGQCKLADFGASAELKQAAAKSEEEDMPVGTPLYMPPEQSRGQATTFSDIWSLGIMVCELCTGKCPWGAIGNILRFIKNLGDPEMNMLPTIPEELTEEARSLAEICIKRDPAQRPSARKLLNHPFLLS
eukprot:TRINITY_DN7723_c0_g3_i1.p1 TRINITY_DN7723_c0_g3~~TRINITY_DN7723_c0_g3_i1.p1  ORF type:complete len:1290 (+),score=367.05 TRINITY_DN7723_c0_g3_i1:119-3988(+)